MALALNTSHPLYSVLVALICVDDDNTIKDLKGDTCTPHANVTKGTGTYGRHFTTLLDGSSNAQGVALTTGFRTKEASPAIGTTLVVVNNISSVANRNSVLDIKSAGAPESPGVSATGKNIITYSDDSTTCEGATVILNNGAHLFGCAFNSTTQNKSFVDGSTESTGAGIGAFPARAKYIGGMSSGGYGGVAANYVWVVQFNKYLSDAEISDLYSSLGANNTFGLVVSAGGGGVTHSAAGALVAQSATLSGIAARSGSAVTHAATGALVVQSAALLGSVSKLVSGTFVSDVAVNNAGTILSNTSVLWEWRKGVGTGVAPVSVTYGSGTTDSNGRLTVTGLPAGAGELEFATPDYVNNFFERGTVV